MLKRFCAGAVVLLAVAGAAVAADAIKIELKDVKIKSAFEGNTDGVQFVEGDRKIAFYTNGSATAEVKVPEDGEYTITVEMSCDEAQGKKAQVKVTAGGEVLKDKYELAQTSAKDYPFTAKLKKGDAKLVIEFLNDTYKENEYDSNLYVHSIKVEKK